MGVPDVLQFRAQHHLRSAGPHTHPATFTPCVMELGSSVCHPRNLGGHTNARVEPLKEDHRAGCQAQVGNPTADGRDRTMGVPAAAQAMLQYRTLQHRLAPPSHPPPPYSLSDAARLAIGAVKGPRLGWSSVRAEEEDTRSMFCPRTMWLTSHLPASMARSEASSHGGAIHSP